MKREEFIEKWGASMGHGFTDEELSADLDELLSLPPAEGAEAFVKSKGLNLDYVKGIQLFLNPKYTVIDLMTEFAAQQQPTAEGAEEYLRKHPFLLGETEDGEDYLSTDDIELIKQLAPILEEFATLHAQRIADKMVSERLRGELIAYDKWATRHLNGSGKIFTAEGAVDEYLESR